MSKKHHHDEGELHFEQIQHHGVQYEDRDLGARGIIVFLIVLCVSGFVLCLMVWGYFDYHARHLKAVPPVIGPQIIADTPNAQINPPEQRFPKPALQTDDVRDMTKLRNDNNEQLTTYGYVDQNAGVAHIPIDKAMDQLSKQGLPTRQGAGQSQTAEFGSGRDNVAGAGGGVRPANNQ
jgi:hypothetical protein